MAEKLTLKKLSDELEAVRAQLQALERRLERKIEAAVTAAVTGMTSGKASSGLAEGQPGIDAEQRQQLIAEQAYLIAEQRGFQGGDPCRDWVEAEKRVNDILLQQSGPRKTSARTRKPAAKKTGTRAAGRAK
ncbi:MAG: DUF2934 domain-containing protein [Gammaproteobacteria bacterium]|jgi:hypothetical protein